MASHEFFTFFDDFCEHICVPTKLFCEAFNVLEDFFARVCTDIAAHVHVLFVFLMRTHA